MEYRRVYVEGGVYFFTLVTFQRRPIFSDPRAVDFLRNAFLKTKIRHPYTMIAGVVLPDHVHVIMKLPVNSSDFSTRIQLIKRYFTDAYKLQSYKSSEATWQKKVLGASYSR